ncbi:hypothetical protein DAEQUDRAFT_815328 [Daedalea quercina L-15889]|uniref:Uncharacterized protein n=1 Tax=Daedalea quercina L-15889 TaxID=1314783 RepID=A0A165L5L9_9APHY|nr:hypothetical protein DAEQUDRAFT_815328 [Daedalea quercina L-15889]
MKFLSLIAFATSSVSLSFAQGIDIGAPADGATVMPGQNIAVEVDRPEHWHSGSRAATPYAGSPVARQTTTPYPHDNHVLSRSTQLPRRSRNEPSYGPYTPGGLAARQRSAAQQPLPEQQSTTPYFVRPFADYPSLPGASGARPTFAPRTVQADVPWQMWTPQDLAQYDGHAREDREDVETTMHGPVGTPGDPNGSPLRTSEEGSETTQGYYEGLPTSPPSRENSPASPGERKGHVARVGRPFAEDGDEEDSG